MHSPRTSSAGHWQIRFEPLVAGATASVFSCDAQGQVELDAMEDRARNDYFFARALIGRDFARPVLVRVESASSVRA